MGGRAKTKWDLTQRHGGLFMVGHAQERSSVAKIRHPCMRAPRANMLSRPSAGSERSFDQTIGEHELQTSILMYSARTHLCSQAMLCTSFQPTQGRSKLQKFLRGLLHFNILLRMRKIQRESSSHAVYCFLLFVDRRVETTHRLDADDALCCLIHP